MQNSWRSPFRGQAGEAGNMPIIVAIFFAVMVGATVEYAQMDQSLKLNSQMIQVRKYGAQVLNESALELVAHIVGTTAIVKAGDGFKLSSGVTRSNSGLWALRDPRTIEVYSCDPHMNGENGEATYGRERDATDPAGCKGRDRTTTVVRVLQFYGGADPAFKVQAISKFEVVTGKALTLKTAARIRIPPPESYVDNTDVCTFMKAQRLPDGAIRYAADGRPYLEPRQEWEERVQIPVNNDLYADPNAPGMKELEIALTEAEAAGKVTKNTTEYSEFHNLGIMSNNNRVKFLGFLMGTDTPSLVWPSNGILDPRLKHGCFKTLGVDADFCTKNAVRYKTLSYNAATGETVNRPFDMCVYFHHHNVANPKTCRRVMGSYCRNNDGCFARNTLITMADGSERSITTIEAGEMVYNPVTRSPAKVDRVISGPESKPLFAITTSKGELKVTDNHPFMTARGLLSARHLKAGDVIWDEKLLFVEVSAVKPLPVQKDERVWNIALDADNKDIGSHMLLANGMVTGDWHLQQLLETGGSGAAEAVRQAMLGVTASRMEETGGTYETR